MVQPPGGCLMAGIFGGDEKPCQSCPTKDEFNKFLQAQVIALQKQLIELASPGANARLAWTQPKRDEKPGPKTTHSPSRIASIRKDVATSPEAIPPALRVSEADFERH